MRIKSLMLVLAVVALSISCTKEVLPSVTLSASVESLEVTSDSNKPAFTLTWKYDGSSAGVVKQYLQFSPQVEYLDPYVASSSGNEYVVTFKDLKKMHDHFGVTEDYTLDIRLLVEGKDVPAVYSNKVKIEMSL